MDGNADLPQDIPKCLGNLDCPDASLFHAITIFRGMQDIWPIFQDHTLCDHREQQSVEIFCAFCLIRSFSYRVNDMNLSSRKKSLKPVELLWIYPNLLEPSVNPTPMKILISILKDIKRINPNSQGWHIMTKNCQKAAHLPYVWQIETKKLEHKSTNLSDIMNMCIRKRSECSCQEDSITIDIQTSNMVILFFQHAIILDLPMRFSFQGIQ